MEFQNDKKLSELAKKSDKTAFVSENTAIVRADLPYTHRFVELWIKIVDNCGNVNSSMKKLPSVRYRNTLFSQYICRKYLIGRNKQWNIRFIPTTAWRLLE